MPIEDFIITVYLCIDEILKTLPKPRKRGPAPLLTEVITMEIVGEFLGFGSDKAIYEYFKNHWNAWFPQLGCRTTFTRQAANLCQFKQYIHKHLTKQIRCDDLFIFDGFPIPTCHPKRVRRKNPFWGDGQFGYCAAKDQTYFGFSGNLLINRQGAIIGFAFTGANVDERKVLPELVQGLEGMTIADKGLISSQTRAF